MVSASSSAVLLAIYTAGVQQGFVASGTSKRGGSEAATEVKEGLSEGGTRAGRGDLLATSLLFRRRLLQSRSPHHSSAGRAISRRHQKQPTYTSALHCHSIRSRGP